VRMTIEQSKRYSHAVRSVIGTRCSLVTNGWNVGSTLSYPESGKDIRLSLFKTGGKLGNRFYHHPEDGRRFESEEAMDAWLIERGFLVPHFRAQWCPIHRRQHHWCHSRTPVPDTWGFHEIEPEVD